MSLGAISFKWPSSLDSIGLTEKDRATIEEQVRRYPLQESHTMTVILQPRNISIEVTFDRGTLTGLHLLLGKRRGKVLSGLQQATTTFCILTRRFGVKKKEVNLTAVVTKHLLATPGQEGLTPVLARRTPVSKKTFDPLTHLQTLKVPQFIELLGTKGTLREWIGNPLLDLPRYKILLIRDLVLGLANLQALRVTQAFNDGEIKCVHPAFNGDIKDVNIFVSNNGRLMIGDWDLSNYLSEMTGSRCYTSPAILTMRALSPEDLIRYREKNGARLDMWSIAVVVVLILKNSYSNKPLFSGILAPLRFIENMFDGGDFNYSTIKRMTQTQIINELEENRVEFEKDPKLAPLAPIWDLLGKLFRKDPSEAILAEEALKYVDFVYAALNPECFRIEKAISACERQIEALITRTHSVSQRLNHLSESCKILVQNSNFLV